MEKKIPLTNEEVTEEWLKEALKDCFIDKEATTTTSTTIKVTKLESVANKGGVLSSVFRATIKVVQSSPTSKSEEQHKLFIKVMPDPKSIQRVFIANFGLDVKEVDTYKRLLPQLEKFELSNTGTSSIKSISPVFYDGHVSLDPEQRGFYVILQDLCPDYNMVTMEGTGLSVKQILLALEQLAYFHALTYSYGQVQNVDFSKDAKYKLPYDKFLSDSGVHEFLKHMFGLAQKDLKTSGHDKLVGIIKNMSDNYKEPFYESYDIDGRFLSHSDMWANNVMFDEGSTKCVLVDWQFCSSSSPFLDYAAIAFLSTSPEVTRQNFQVMLEKYFDKFANTVAKHKVDLMPFSLEEFEEGTKRKGFFALFIWLIFSYDPCVIVPGVFERFVWIFEQALLYSPEKFKDFM